MHLGHHVFAVHGDGLLPGSTQSHMQDGPLLGNIDFVAAKHGVYAAPQTGLLSQMQQKRKRLIGDAVLRVVEVNASGLERHPLPPAGVVCKKFFGDATPGSSCNGRREDSTPPALRVVQLRSC